MPQPAAPRGSRIRAAPGLSASESIFNMYLENEHAPRCDCRICTRPPCGAHAPDGIAADISTPWGQAQASLSAGVLRRSARDCSAPPPLPTHTLVVCANLNAGWLEAPTARISPIPPGTEKAVLNLAVDPRHPLLATAAISLWHHTPTLRHLVIIITPSLGPALTAADRDRAEAILEHRNTWRYLPALGILEWPLRSLSLSAEPDSTVEVTLVGLGALPHRALGFSEFPLVGGQEAERLVQKRARRFDNLDVRCVSQLQYANEVGWGQFELESRLC